MSASWWQNLFNPSALKVAAQKSGVDLSYLESIGIPGIGSVNTPFKTIPVRKEDLPALRQLIKRTLPKLGPHDRQSIEQVASNVLGGPLSELANKQSIGEYANYVNYLGGSKNIGGTLKLISSLIETVGNSEGRLPTESEAKDLAGKQTLASRFIQAGTEQLDTPIATKVESIVQGDVFNYWVDGNGDGIYNGMYLKDAQWQQDVHFKEPLNLPLSGNDQLYFPGFVLDPRWRNEQPVELELADKFTDDFYALYAAGEQKWDPLHDKQVEYEPIMGKVQYSYMIPEITLVADGSYPYRDPEQPQSSAFNNRVGMRPWDDSYRNPTEPSRFDTELTASPGDQIQSVTMNGQQQPIGQGLIWGTKDYMYGQKVF